MVKIILSYKCYQKERKQADEINVNGMSTEIQNDENTENQNGYAVDDEGEDCMRTCSFVTANWLNPEAEGFTSLIIKNSGGADFCSNCGKKLVNGIRYTTCKKPWHWDAVACRRMPDIANFAVGNLSLVLAPT